jgi:hypothetical protein
VKSDALDASNAKERQATLMLSLHEAGLSVEATA